MGEAVVSSDEVMEVELKEEEERNSEREGKGDKEDKEKKSSSGVIRWGRFLPRMVLRVLLVEADDSTRQIISALLRKCSYRVVAVSDGLKAWEALKGGSQNVDLILTEVDLPSISGFSLLTLIMEDDIYKKIPVIMMSSHDSISVVLKCMLKGAADFLIKPVRKNELRNLWQHVWRRHTPTGGHVPQNFSIALNKVEVSSENDTASIHSSDYVVSAQKKKECSEKGSDAQSSCTTPYMEAESAYMEKMQGFSLLKCRNLSNLSSKETRNHHDRIESDKEPDRLGSLTGGKRVRLESDVAPGDEGYHSAALRWEESHRDSTDITGENHGCNEKRIESSKGAVDLISTFGNHPKDCNQFSSSNDGINKDGFAPQLELSLRRFQPCGSKTCGSDERHTLNHSNSSAFSWYNNGKALQPFFPPLTNNCTEPKEDANYSHERLFNRLPENTVGTSERHGATRIVTQRSMTTLVISQSDQAGAAFPTSQLGLPAQGVRFDSLCAGYGHILPPIFHTQLGSSPIWSPKSAWQKCSHFSTSSSRHYNVEIQTVQQDCLTSKSTDETVHEQENILEPNEELSHGSPVAGQSASGNLCNGVVSHVCNNVHGSICHRNDSNPTSNGAVMRTTALEIVNGEDISNHDGLKGMDSHHSTQREAALIKFRLKRKDRCFQKKVRYQSRKRLAEQRPRVKGQFVRQVQTDTQIANG